MKLKNVKIILLLVYINNLTKHLTFYWRLKEHVKFAEMIGIKNFSEILPRMSRDFLVKFKNETDAINAEKLLNSFYASKDDIKIFEVDNRGQVYLLS